MKEKVVVASIALCLGLAVGGVFVGRAVAQQPQGQFTPRVRYQYMCVTNMEPRIYKPEVQGKLNELGGQGWRLMENRDLKIAASSGGFGNMYGDVYCFERAY